MPKQIRKFLAAPLLICAVLAVQCFSIEIAFAQDNDDEREPVVWSLSFEGNENYSSIVLRQIIATERPNVLQRTFRRVRDYRLSETELQRDRIRIERYYQRRGYPDVNVEYEVQDRRRDWQKDVVFTITEGDPIRISRSDLLIDAKAETEQELRDNETFMNHVSRNEFAEGNIYQPIRRADVEGRVYEALQNQGYPWPEVQIEADIDTLAKNAEIEVIAKPGTKSYFTNFIVEGDLSVPERIVLRETGIKEGDVYDRRKLQEAQRQLFNHHLFRFATVSVPEQEQDSTLDVRIRVREHPLRSIQASIGLGREEFVRGQLSWQHRNINGTGHRLGFTARGSFIEQRLGADYTIPYVFNNRSSFVSSPYGQRRVEPAFEIVRAGINNSLIYQIERNRTATMSYEFSVNEELARREGAELPDNVLGYNVSSLTFSGYFAQELSRDPVGWIIQPSAEFSGTFGESTFRFQKFTLDTRYFEPLTSSTKLAGRVNLGATFYGQDDDLPSNIRFFAGGTNSVRGWSRQNLGPKRPSFNDDGQFAGYVPIGGRALFNANLELRQQLDFLFSGLGMATFIDGGQVWRNVQSLDERPVQFGVGGGLRYQSPIGPIRVDVAYKVNPTDEDLGIFEGQDFGGDWSRIGIHFSIGQAF